MVFSLLFVENFLNFFIIFFVCFFDFALLLVSVFQRKSPMLSNFSKFSRKNGSFFATDIFLDRYETVRAVGGKDRVRNDLEFIVPDSDVRITDHWRGDGEAQTGHFHVIFMQNGLRFPLFEFVLEILHDYGVVLSQLASNAYRIIAAFYLGCHVIGVAPTSRLFRNFFFLKMREKFYFLQSRGKPVVTGLPDTNKGRKPLFLRITNLTGFRVDLQLRAAKTGGNKAPTLTLIEQKYYSKILDNENGFP